MTPITEPGFYDIPEDVYHADPVAVPSLSASIAKMLVNQKETPRHAWMQHPRLNPGFERDGEYKAAQAFGTVCHKLMLGKGGDVAVIEGFDNFKKGEARAQRDEALAAGRTPILAHDYERAEQVIKAGRAQLQRHEDAHDAFASGQPEMTAVHNIGETWIRCRFDWLPSGGNVVHDYKTVSTTANADQWAKQAFDLGSDIQDALYSRVYKALRGIESQVHFRFVVQEMNPPYALNVIEFSGAAKELANMKCDEAIRRWQWCMKHDAWPGHPNRVCYADAPVWHERAWEDHTLRKEVADKDLMEMMNQWQAPHEEGEAA